MTHFERGTKLGNESTKLHISLNDVWSADLKNGGSDFSYEKIGYHAGSVEFLDGMLSTGCPVDMHMEEDGRLVVCRIESNPWK